MALDAAKTASVPHWKMIYDWLRAEVGKYEYGDDFYTVRDICQRFGVSSITAVRSLNELAGQGLIEKIQGKGNVVRRVPRQASLWLLTAAAYQKDAAVIDSIRGRLIEGIRAATRQQGVELGTINESHLRGLFPRGGTPNGFLLVRPYSADVRDFIRDHRLPHVLVDPIDDYKGWPHARLDRFRAGYLATRHLLGLGHRRIAWITGLVSQQNFRDRIRGYRKALREAGIAFKWDLVAEVDTLPDGTLSAEALELALDRLVGLRRPPTALIMGDDSRAIRILDACRRRGIQVPGGLSVVGYPNSSESALTDPPLTVVDGRYEKVGESAVQLLLEQMFHQADSSGQAVRVRPALVERASTGPAPDRRRQGVSVARAGGADGLQVA